MVQYTYKTDQGNQFTYIFHIPCRVGHGVDGQIDNTGNGDDHNKCWRDVAPANPPVHMRPEAKHILNVIFKSIKKNMHLSPTINKTQLIIFSKGK